ncbi:amidase [Penicillium malachiteum]|uniref:amidase n=1 Tax=Penicillium malachiteum TaxID=1324776 RepID=UPI0025480427|nr:amidase [Penicillium malachiteum]KAJ5737504.1 amidase [Penicillium malachiteum]
MSLPKESISWFNPAIALAASLILPTTYCIFRPRLNMLGLFSIKKVTPAAAVDSLDLQEISRALQEGIFTSEDLLYLSRISQVNDHVRAVGCINPDAKSIALQRDQERRNSHVYRPLHGIPFLVKDTFITLDQMDTTGGSYALVGAKYKLESTLTTKLRDAGAILLGKTNLSEWGMSRSSNCKSGWSPLYGQAVGGFYEDQDPQGSSSGSAIAVSLKLASFAIGGETCGSILYPAQKNGVIGLKPTPGLTSRAGTIPINPEQDSVGPLTQYVKDSAIILNAITGQDSHDSATNNIPFKEIPDYQFGCQKDALRGVRVAVPKSVYGIADSDSDPEVGIAFRNAVSQFRGLGAIIIDEVDFEHWKPRTGQQEDLFGDVLLREALNEFFEEVVKSPPGVEKLESLGTDQIHRVSEEFLASKARMEFLGDDVARLLDQYQCDTVLATSSTDLPLDLGRLPGIQIPLGFYSAECEVVRNLKGMVTKAPNIPYGITLTGRRFSEEKLIACAYAFEQATLTVRQNEERLFFKQHLG